MSIKNYSIFLAFALLIFLPLPSMAAEPAKRALEIVYPQIPGVETPKYVSTGLPDYVNYIFRFSVIVFGILIFGVLIYSGAKYMLSFGSPTKLSEAKEGITSAGLGALILLGAYLIFNTINPQLLILTPPEVGTLKAYIVPGVYICNYELPYIGDILIKYMGSNLELRTEAAEKLKDAMGKAGSKKNCFLANYSGILRNFVIKAGSTNWTLFIIPSEKYNPDDRTYGWEFKHGAVFHENDKFGGKCKLFPATIGTGIYHQVGASDFHPKLSFDARAVTIFQKPDLSPTPASKGVTLYEEQAFKGKSMPFKPDGDAEVHSVTTANLKTAGLYKDDKGNVKSMEIDPKDGYFAVLQGKENKCEVRRADDANLTDDPIGRCGWCNIVWQYTTSKIGWTNCYSCLEFLYVIKGQVL